MRHRSVPLDQIALWLGHVRPPSAPDTTLIYSPGSPEHLPAAKLAVEEFVNELNALTDRNLLAPPWRS